MPDRSRRGAVRLLYAFVILGPILLHAQHLGPGRIPYLRDLSRTHLAYKEAAVAEFRMGRIPAWLPAHGAGTPLFADANYFHLHPASLPFLVLPYTTAFSLVLAALSVLGSLGTALWLRSRGATPAGAAVGALAFALGGLGASITNLYNLLASYTSVPWALWASERLAAAPGGRRLGLLALCLAATILGGEPSAWAWAVLFPLVLGPALRSRPSLLAHALAAVLSLGLAAGQLLPLIALTGETARGIGFTLAESAYHSLAPARLRELIQPFPWGNPTRPWEPDFRGGELVEGTTFLYSLYLGVSVALLACAGLLARGTGRARLALAALGGLSLLLALGRYTPVFPLLWHALPPLHLFRYPCKLLLGFALAVSALATLGADALQRRAPGLPGFLLALVVAAELLSVHLDLVPGTPAEPFRSPPPAARIVTGHRVYFWLEPDRWGSAESDRVAFHFDYQRRLAPPAGIPFGVSYVMDPDPDRLDSRRMVALGTLLHRSESNRERLMPVVAADFVLAPRPLARAWLEPIPVEGAYLYRTPSVAYARVLAGPAVISATSMGEALRALAEPGFEPRDRVVFEGIPPPAGPAGDIAVTVVRPRPSVIDLEAAGPGLLVVSESFSSAWQATVDGQSAPLAPANVAFIGIPLLDPGLHQIRLEYRPRSIPAGIALSLASLAISILLLLHRPGPGEPVHG